jgi:PAS domain S-box
MRKRIFLNLMGVTIISLLVTAIALSVTFYYQLANSIQSELRQRVSYVADMDTEAIEWMILQNEQNTERVSIIAVDGTVIFDSSVGIDELENHLDREEVTEAFNSGVGESTRYSDTLGQETYYYAILLQDGNVLRVSRTSSSIIGIFNQLIPFILLIIVIISFFAYFLASKLTLRIVKPINTVDLNAELVPPYDELAPFVKTIAEQRHHIQQQMAAIEERTNTISMIMESTQEGILIVDEQGVILSINNSAASFFGIAEETTGKNILEIYRDLEIIEHIRTALLGKRSEININKEERTYRVYFSPAIDKGAIVLFLDITERIQAEFMRQEFSANVSHELKTPLTSIYGNAELLENGMVKEEDKKMFYTKMKDESERLIALIDDILLLSRLDENAGKSHFESVDLYVVAKETLELLETKINENKIETKLIGTSCCYFANKSLMTELFYNLIENAVKYNKVGGEITIELESDEKEVQIMISDTGVGIAPEDQERVFERFYRVEKSRSKDTGGTGLGLAIVKHIVLTHGGILTLNSALGKGTTILISFPKVK